MLMPMTRTLLLMIAVFSAFAVLGMAQDDAAYSAAMKAVNASAGRGGPLRTAVMAKDVAGAAAEGKKIEAAFDTVVAYWTAKKVDDAVKLATTARDAAKTIADAKDADAQNAAMTTLNMQCGQCHMAHRAPGATPGTFTFK
jgi:hypothetical protein